MPWTADGKWVPEDDSVATRLTGMLATNSPYIKTARAAGQRTAARRGLLNSSIAAGAGESAAIGAAAPIASQDASQTFQRNQAVLEGGIGFENNSRLQAQQVEGQRGLNEQQNVAATERLKLEQQGATEAQLREYDQRTAEQTRGIEADATRQTEQLSSNERQALLGAETNLLQTQVGAQGQLAGQYLQAFSTLAGDPNIPAQVRNTYIAEFQRVMEQSQKLIAVMRNTR